MAYNGYAFSGRYTKGNIAQHIIFIIVGKPNLVKYDFTVYLFWPIGVGWIGYIRICIEKFENPFRGGHGALQHIVFFGKIADGTEELFGKLNKGHQCAVTYRFFQPHHPAAPQYQRYGHGAYHFDSRIENRVIENHSHIGPRVLGVYPAKLFEIFFLAVEHLHNAHACDVLLQKRIDLRQPFTHLPESHSYFGFKDMGNQKQYGNYGKGP